MNLRNTKCSEGGFKYTCQALNFPFDRYRHSLASLINGRKLRNRSLIKIAGNLSDLPLTFPLFSRSLHLLQTCSKQRGWYIMMNAVHLVLPATATMTSEIKFSCPLAYISHYARNFVFGGIEQFRHKLA